MKMLLYTIIMLVSVICRGGVVELKLFGSTGCDQCMRVEQGIVSETRQLFPKMKFVKVLTDDIEGFKALLRLEEAHGNDANESVKIFVGLFPDDVRCLAGVDQIEAELIQVVSEYDDKLASGGIEEVKPVRTDQKSDSPQISDQTEPDDNIDTLAQKRLKKFTLGAIIAAGLIDGVNPCVFATMVFFMGMLAASQVTGRKLLAVGLSFCAGSFVMYTAMGFGLLHVIREFWAFAMIRKCIEWGMIVVLGYFAIRTFREAMVIRKLGVGIGDACNLPLGVVGRIRQAITQGMHMRYLILGAFSCALVVTAFESMCTGQVYIPTLVLIIDSGSSLLKGWTYLLIYNAACITPLLLIFLFVYSGVEFSVFEQWNQKHTYAGKLFLSAFFVLMLVLILLIKSST